MSLPRYPEYKDSGVDWLGKVPGHWSVAPLKRSFKIVGGSTPKSEQESYWDGEFVWVTPSDLSKLSSMCINDSQRKITAKGLASCGTTLVPSGSIVLSTRAPIGSLAIAGTELCTNQGCKSLVPFADTQSQFYGYLLSISTGELNIRGKGTTFLELSGDELGAFKVGVPPSDEQQTIAAFLDRETGKIDALIAEQQRLVELLAEKRQAVISHAVTKGLNPNAPMKDSGIEWLGEVPENWEVKRLGTLFRETSDEGEADRPILSVSIHDGVSDRELDDKELDRKVTRSEDRGKYKSVEPGDLVYNMMRAWQGGFGTVKVVGMVSPAYVVARPCGYFKTEFLEQQLRSPQAVEEMRRYSRGVTDFRLRLYWDEFKSISVALAPKEEQVAIAIFLDRETAKFDILTTEANRAIALLQERRSALISAAVTGKIDVRNAYQTEAA